MNNESYINEVLDAYVQRKLSREDAAAELNKQGVSEPAHELDLHMAAVIALRQGNMLHQVQNVHKQFLQAQQEKTGSSNTATGKLFSMNRSLKWIYRAAAVLLIMTAGWFAYNYSTTNSKNMYAAIYQPYNVNNDRAAIEEIVPHNMLQQFKDKDYAAVIKTYQGLTTTTNREKFLAAISCQETGDHEQAISILEQILNINREQQSRMYNDEAEFYLALNYLKVKNRDAAISLFRKIYNDPGHTYQERITKTILRKMKWLQ